MIHSSRADGPTVLVDIVQDEVMQGIEVELDHKCFDNCLFERCTLLYSGGPVEFRNTIFRECRYVFLGPARATVHFLEATGVLSPDHAKWGEYSAPVH